jgi:hypothetical protein
MVGNSQATPESSLPGLVVFKLDMKTVFNTDLHLDRVVSISRHDIGMNPDILFLDNVGKSPQDGDSDKVTKLDIDSMIALVLLLHILELEIKRGFVAKFTRNGEILLHRPELVMIAAVVEHLYATHKLDFDTIMFHLLAIPDLDVDLKCKKRRNVVSKTVIEMGEPGVTRPTGWRRGFLTGRMEKLKVD